MERQERSRTACLLLTCQTDYGSANPQIYNEGPVLHYPGNREVRDDFRGDHRTAWGRWGKYHPRREVLQTLQFVKQKESGKIHLQIPAAPGGPAEEEGNQNMGQKLRIVKTALNNLLKPLKYSNVFSGHRVENIIHVSLGTSVSFDEGHEGTKA